MPSWDYDAWDADRPANRYQAEIDQAFRDRRELYGQHETQGWRRQHEPVCPKCWYTIVDGECVRGCTSLSGRESAEGGAAQAQRRRGTGWSHVAEAPEADTDSGFMAGGRTVVGDSRPESDEKAAA
jgi:hypothetical protein